jgi:hypothetical protein
MIKIIYYSCIMKQNVDVVGEDYTKEIEMIVSISKEN